MELFVAGGAAVNPEVIRDYEAWMNLISSICRTFHNTEKTTVHFIESELETWEDSKWTKEQQEGEAVSMKLIEERYKRERDLMNAILQEI